MPDQNLLSRHPWGLHYLSLWLAAWLIRLPSFLGMFFVQRRAFKALRSDVSRTRIQIPSRDKHRHIIVDVYEQVGQPKNTPRFVHLNFHGSGFVLPSLGTDIDFCAQLASTGTVVLDADYRKAPEFPFPAAYHDAEDLLSYIRSHESDFDIHHVTISGFSAGANLAMATAVNSPPGSISGVVSIYGNVDMTRAYPAPNEKVYDTGMILPQWLRAFFYHCLILPGQSRSDPRLSPAYAPLTQWPKHVFLACGAADNLHESGRIMAERLKAAGHADADFLSVEREAHGFDKFPKKMSPTEKRRNEMYEQAISMIDRAHQTL